MNSSLGVKNHGYLLTIDISSLTKQLINVEANKSSVSAIVEEVAKKEMEKHI